MCLALIGGLVILRRYTSVVQITLMVMLVSADFSQHSTWLNSRAYSEYEQVNYGSVLTVLR